MNQDTGKLIIIIAVILLLAGIIIYFFHNKLHWIGHLPGDIRIERENFKFYFPVTTMILASIFISLLLFLVKKLL